MAKNEHIYERRGKKGLTLQIKIPYGNSTERRYFSGSIKAYEYPTKAAAYEAARMVRDQAVIDIRNSRVFESVPTVGELYEDYWRMSPASINTKEQYDMIFKYVMAPLADKKIDVIEAADIQSVLAAYAVGHSQQMVQKGKYIWHIVFVAAQMRGLNIADKTLILMPIVSRKPARKNKKETVITYEQLLEFTSAIIGNPRKLSPHLKKMDRDIWYLIWLMYYTGCRPAEALAIDSGDIDLENKVLHIVKAVGSTKDKYRQIVATKRPSSYRHFPISEELEVLLRDLLRNSSSAPLLMAPDGQPYKIGDIVHRIICYSNSTGIPFNLYQLRHKFSDDMFENNVSPVVVRDLMGHASATMSLEYAKATPAQMQEAVSGVKRTPK